MNSLLKLLQTSNVIYNVFIYARMHETFYKRNVKTYFSNMFITSKRIFSERKRLLLSKNKAETVAL